MEYQDDLLKALVEPDGFPERVRAFVAPVAHQADAVSTDLASLQVAEAVYEAFGDLDVSGGLTRAELAAACGRTVSAEAFASRFDLFVSMGLLRRNRDKPSQRRYVLNPTSVAALLVFERLRDVGGVQEILALLDRTRQDLLEGKIQRETLLERLTRARRGLSIFASHLLHLIRTRPWEELLAERSHHRSTDKLLSEAKTLVTVVSSRFPDLAGVGSRLIREALRYSGAVNEFCDRLLEQASARRDFSMLLPEQYLSAALNTSVNDLAAPFARTVFDPASLVVTPEQIIHAIEKHRPTSSRHRPPRPPAVPLGPDPIDEARRRVGAERRRIGAEMELHLQGGVEVDLTSRIRGAGWPGAARIVADALSANADPSIDVEVHLSEALIVDPLGPVSHVTPMSLRRLPQTNVDVDSPAFGAVRV